MSELEEIDATRQRAIALYTFLKELTELRSRTIRTVDQYDHVLWFSDVPNEQECECAAWRRGQNGDSAEVWLEVHQPCLVPPPQPPAELGPWLVEAQITDSSIKTPELRAEITIPVGDGSDAQRLERRVIEDWPDVKPLWEQYIEAEWRPWAVVDRRAQCVQNVYTQLFSIYQKQQRLGEQYEVVLGVGLASWRMPDGHEIQRHLIAASASVAFDAARGIMTVGPAGEGAKPQIEQDMLDPKYRPNPEALRALESQVAEVGDQLWEPTPVDAVLAAWVRSVSPNGVYEGSLSPPDRILLDPRVHFAPALILRKRTERSYVRAFEEIIRRLREGGAIPPGVGRFVTVTEDPELQNARDHAVVAGELYFPLESNEAQRKIVERLSQHQGVLVQGPPGTGKSHTIVNLVCHLLAAGQRVLVTSHTARALKVLQGYLRKRVSEISPLAVVLLGDDRDALQAMEDSVQGITDRHHRWDPDAQSKRLRDAEAQLNENRREEAKVLSDLRAIRENETYIHPRRFGVYEGTLKSIATRLRQEQSAYDWMEDRPYIDQHPPLSAQEFQNLLSLLDDDELDVWQSAGLNALDISVLPSPDDICDLISRETETRAAYEGVSEARHRPEYAALADADAGARKALLETLTALLGGIDQVRRHMQAWVEECVSEILGDHDRGWKDLLDTTREHLSCIDDRARWADETPVSGLGNSDLNAVRADAEAILAHLESGGKWGFGPFRAATAKRTQYLRREIKIGGRACGTPDQLKALISRLEVENRLGILRGRWAALCIISADSAFSAQVSDFGDLCEPLEAALSLLEGKSQVRDVIQRIPGISDPTWHDLNALRLLRDCAAAVDNELNLRNVEKALRVVRERITSEINHAGTDPAGRDLLRALESHDPGGYRDAFSVVSHNEQLAKRLKQRECLWSDLRLGAPALSDKLAANPRGVAWTQRAAQYEAAWNWARTKAWIERLCDPNIEQQLLFQLDSVRNRIRRHLKEIAAEKAWSHCFARMTEHERQHLVAWSKAVQKIGTATGKYTAQHRCNAREHMNQCRSAIPAWVMPIYRVAETIRPGSDLFDVVIIDEASQSGPEALLLAFLAKKLVVVGDDKQISPTNVGIDREDVNHLRARHIADLPHADSYGMDQSFFDLSEIRYQGRIRLREHFRCMSEIIQFSNNLCYSSEPLIPLRQYGTSHLSPVVSARHVPDGYLKGAGQAVSNPVEAQAIVDEILLMHAGDAYIGKTFGVISLQGPSQAREIETLLLHQMGPEEMEKRQLVCGDAYAFQGDERDVMLLSLVSAPTEGRRIGTLAGETARRRFNVAASRARDQMVLFHSATLNDLSPKCLRYLFLQYCQSPSIKRQEILGRPIGELQHLAAAADRERVRAPEPFESWFELDVFLRVAARGYRVLPQYEVAGYRIDLVVEGMERRIAVECDGDRWHGPESYDEDMARQRMLERCGWKFWRLRGSAFALDSEGSLEGLWETLEREQVYPDSYDHGSNGQTKPVSMSSNSCATESKDSKHTSGDSASIPVESPICFAGEPEITKSSIRSKRPPRSAEQPRQESLPLNEVTRLAEVPQTGCSAVPRLPDPAQVSPAHFVPALLRIVSAEGPMTTDRLFRAFVKGAGRQRVGRQFRSALNKAVWKAIREGDLDESNEIGQNGLKERVLRVSGSPPVVVRPRGNREFVEIPPSEVATVMCRLERRDEEHHPQALYRALLDFYDTKRMTANIQQRLQWIHERRNELADTTEIISATESSP